MKIIVVVLVVIGLGFIINCFSDLLVKLLGKFVNLLQGNKKADNEKELEFHDLAGDFGIFKFAKVVIEAFMNDRSQLMNFQKDKKNYGLLGLLILSVTTFFIPFISSNVMAYSLMDLIPKALFLSCIIILIFCLLATLLNYKQMMTGSFVLYSAVLLFVGLGSYFTLDDYVKVLFKPSWGFYLMILIPIVFIVLIYIKNNGLSTSVLNQTVPGALLRLRTLQKKMEEIGDDAIECINNLIEDENCPESLLKAVMQMKNNPRSKECVDKFAEEIQLHKDFISDDKREMVVQYASYMRELFTLMEVIKLKRS